MSDDKRIWDLLMEAIGNPYGVAGLMGNLMAESSMNPLRKTGGKGYVKSISGFEYAQKVMTGDITPYDFAHDGIAFGLAQWCYWSRKEALFKYCRENNLDIGSLDCQVGYLLGELPKYKTVWKTLKDATSIGEASDIVLLRYEKPANTSDKVKVKRQLYGQQFYEKYAQKSATTTEDMINTLNSVCMKYELNDYEKDIIQLVVDNYLRRG